MSDPANSGGLRASGLSARLLLLTAGFVMLSEVLVFVPSISRFRLDYLHHQVVRANLAVLALEATPNNMVDDALGERLLDNAGAYAVSLKTKGRRMLMLGERTPPKVDAAVDLRSDTILDWIVDALAALVRRSDRIILVIADAPRQEGATIEVLSDERPMIDAMRAFGWRILGMSLIISLITGGLVYLSLQWLMVRPILRITETIARFQATPEDEATNLRPSARRDEIGAVERALAEMQRALRSSLRQKSHLAALGTAVAKINHDLKNTLSTAVLASDRLADIDDPVVRKLAPSLLKAIDRAVGLCGRTLDFVRSGAPPLRETRFALGDLVREVAPLVQRADGADPGLERLTGDADHIVLEADRDQLFRVLINLSLNAAQAGARNVLVSTATEDNRLLIDVRDDGPGVPEQARARMFQPFAASSRSGGSGLGLVIAREIVVAHGGDLTLLDTGAAGATFRIVLPARRLAG